MASKRLFGAKSNSISIYFTYTDIWMSLQESAYASFREDYFKIKNASLAVNAAEQGLLYEKDFEQVSEQKRQEIISIFTQRVKFFTETYEAFLLEIWCNVSNLKLQKIDWEEIQFKKKAYLEIHDSKRFIDFLHNEEYPDQLKQDIKDITFLDTLDQIRNNYQKFVDNGFLDVLPFRKEMFGPKSRNFVINYMEKQWKVSNSQ